MGIETGPFPVVADALLEGSGPLEPGAQLMLGVADALEAFGGVENIVEVLEVIHEDPAPDGKGHILGAHRHVCPVA